MFDVLGVYLVDFGNVRGAEFAGKHYKVYWVEHKSKAGDVSSVVVHISFMTEVEDGKLNRFECYKVMEPELEGFDKMEVNNQLTVYKAR